MSDVRLEVLNRSRARNLLDALADLYVPTYTEPPYNAASKFSRTRFLERTRRQVESPGFTLVTAWDDAALTGFTFGFSMAPGSWWANASLPAHGVMREAKFAVIELLVARQHRGRGIGLTLLDTLLERRPESYATLAVVIGADAYDWYLRRGWVKVAEFRAEPPFSDALLLDLRR